MLVQSVVNDVSSLICLCYVVSLRLMYSFCLQRGGVICLPVYGACSGLITQK